MPRRKAGEVLDLQVNFEGVSFGAKTARLGVKVDRSQLTISEADKKICERRLTGTILSKAPDEQPDQGHFPGMDTDNELHSSFDVKSFTVHGDYIGFGLTFALKGLDRQSLTYFAKRTGKVFIDVVDNIPEPEKAPKADEPADEEPEEDPE